MKNILGLRADNTEVDCLQKFLCRSVDPVLSIESDKLIEESRKFDKAANSKKYDTMTYVFFMGFIFSLLIAVSQSKVGNKTASIISFAVAALFIALFLVVYFSKKKKENQILQSDDFQELQKRSEELYLEMCENLQIPSTAVKVDAFIYMYKYDKKGNLKNANDLAKYYNQQFIIFNEDDNFMFADIENVMSFKLSGFKYIEKLKNVSFIGWNKEEPQKEYKVRLNQYGINFSRCARIVYEEEQEEYEIVIPEYEIENFNYLLNIEVKDSKEN